MISWIWQILEIIFIHTCRWFWSSRWETTIFCPWATKVRLDLDPRSFLWLSWCKFRSPFNSWWLRICSRQTRLEFTNHSIAIRKFETATFPSSHRKVVLSPTNHSTPWHIIYKASYMEELQLVYITQLVHIQNSHGSPIFLTQKKSGGITVGSYGAAMWWSSSVLLPPYLIVAA